MIVTAVVAQPATMSCGQARGKAPAHRSVVAALSGSDLRCVSRE